MPGRGWFIAIEGGDGAGKGSVIGHVETQLAAAGYTVVSTREPGGTPEGLALRALLLSAAGDVWDRHAELLLMTAARVQHVRRLIEPALANGSVVVCDRFVGSSIAYQGGGRGLSETLIADLHRGMVGEVWPDLTLLLDVDPEIALARSHARLSAMPAVDEGRFESLDLAFHHRVRAAYLRQAAGQPGWVALDAARPLAEVQRAAQRAVTRRLGDHLRNEPSDLPAGL